MIQDELAITPEPGRDCAQDLSISIVTYAPDLAILQQTLQSLERSVAKAVAGGLISRVKLVLVDHGPEPGWYEPLSALLNAEWTGEGEILSPGGNDGYGAGHNRAVAHAQGSYHLVLNPDTVLEEDAIVEAICYLNENPEIGLLTPKAFWPSGERQYLCKQYPSLLDLLLRGFAPKPVQQWCVKRLGHYEMRGITEDEVIQEVPIASGCFMFLRRAAFDAVDGFSPRFFLYFEDFDLSIRLGQAGWGITYLPSVIITHYGGKAAKKGVGHMRMFITSAVLFFNLHGWKLY
jgi:GT2 family glycosyltransferase